MPANKLANPVLSNNASNELLCKVLDNLRRWRYTSITKLVYMLNKNVFLYLRKALSMFGKGILSTLLQAQTSAPESRIVDCEFLGCCPIIGLALQFQISNRKLNPGVVG